MLLTLVLGASIGLLGMVLIRQFLDGALVDRPTPGLAPSAFPRLAPPRRVRSPYRPVQPIRRAA